jgi:hypothetical protein
MLSHEASPDPRSSGRNAPIPPAAHVTRGLRQAYRWGRARSPGSPRPRRNAKTRSALASQLRGHSPCPRPAASDRFRCGAESAPHALFPASCATSARPAAALQPFSRCPLHAHCSRDSTGCPRNG